MIKIKKQTEFLAIDDDNKTKLEENYFDSEGKNLRTLHYDESGRLELETQWEYEGGILVREIVSPADGESHIKTFAYDENGEPSLIRDTYNDGSWEEERIQFDGKTQVTEMLDDSGEHHSKIVSKFDSEGNMVYQEYYEFDEQLSSTEFEYNDKGYAVNIKTHDQVQNEVSEETNSYQYDRWGNVSETTTLNDNGNLIYHAKYVYEGELLKECYENSPPSETI